jgi:hypothetical protein
MVKEFKKDPNNIREMQEKQTNRDYNDKPYVTMHPALSNEEKIIKQKSLDPSVNEYRKQIFAELSKLNNDEYFLSDNLDKNIKNNYDSVFTKIANKLQKKLYSNKLRDSQIEKIEDLIYELRYLASLPVDELEIIRSQSSIPGNQSARSKGNIIKRASHKIAKRIREALNWS